MPDYFGSFMRGTQLGNETADRQRAQRVRNALGMYNADPDRARQMLLQEGDLDSLNALGQYDTEREADAMRQEMAQAAGGGNAASAAVAAQAMKPATPLPPAQPGAQNPITLPAPHPINGAQPQATPPAPQLAGGPIAPQAQQAPQAAAASPQQPDLDPAALGGVQAAAAPGAAAPDGKLQPGQALQAATQATGADQQIAQIDRMAQIALRHGDVNTWNNMMGRRHELLTQSQQDFMARLNFLGQAADQLRTVPAANRLEAAVQMLSNTPFGQGQDPQTIRQSIQSRLDPNGDGTISDPELDNFKRGLMTVAEQATNDLQHEELNIMRMRIHAAGGGGAGGGGGISDANFDEHGQYSGQGMMGWDAGAINQAAHQVLSGDLTPLQGLRSVQALRLAGTIRATAAHMAAAQGRPDAALALASSALTASRASLRQATITMGALRGAELTASGLFDQAERLYDSLPPGLRGPNRTLNNALQGFVRNLGGAAFFERASREQVVAARDAALTQAQRETGGNLDSRLTQLYNYITEGVTDYAKVMSGAYGAGGNSDHASMTAESLMHAAMNPGAFHGALQAARQGMEIRRHAQLDNINGIMGDIAAIGGNAAQERGSIDADTGVHNGQFTAHGGRPINWNEGSINTLRQQLANGSINTDYISTDDAQRVVDAWDAAHNSGGSQANGRQDRPAYLNNILRDDAASDGTTAWARVPPAEQQRMIALFHQDPSYQALREFMQHFRLSEAAARHILHPDQGTLTPLHDQPGQILGRGNTLTPPRSNQSTIQPVRGG